MMAMTPIATGFHQLLVSCVIMVVPPLCSMVATSVRLAMNSSLFQTVDDRVSNHPCVLCQSSPCRPADRLSQVQVLRYRMSSAHLAECTEFLDGCGGCLTESAIPYLHPLRAGRLLTHPAARLTMSSRPTSLRVRSRHDCDRESHRGHGTGRASGHTLARWAGALPALGRSMDQSIYAWRTAPTHEFEASE